MSSVIFEYNHQPILKWKGRTFNQITSTMKKNPGLTGTINTHNLFLANPLKIYRKEIANTSTVSTCSRRASLKIDEFDRPGGSVINTKIPSNANGLVNTIDNTLPNNTCEEPGTCLSFLSPALNAKRRCRSAGMIHQKYNGKNLPKYFTDAKQYLHSRNYTYDQNQFRYPVSDPSYCVTYKPNNTQFAQQGGVTASSLTARLKYNAIQTAALQTAKPLGIATANALAYGVPENGYTIKDILGYPNPYFQKDKLKCVINSPPISTNNNNNNNNNVNTTSSTFMVISGQTNNGTGGSYNLLAYTTDGINYTTTTAPSANQSQVSVISAFQGVMCFWAGANGSGPIISSDGMTWLSTTPLPVSTPVNAAIYFNNKYYSGGSTGPSSFQGVYTSTSPVTNGWTAVPVSGLVPTGMFACKLNSVSTLFVLNQASSGNMIYSTTDGVTWTGASPYGSPFYKFSNSKYGTSFASNGSKVVVIGQTPFKTPNPYAGAMVYTTDGVTWNNCNFDGSSGPTFGSIAYGNGLWMVSGYLSGVGTLWNSTDGITFNKSTNPMPFATISAIGFINGTWVATRYTPSNGGSSIAYSTNNGASWTVLPSAFGITNIYCLSLSDY
jgi:hypothetical protein